MTLRFYDEAIAVASVMAGATGVMSAVSGVMDMAHSHHATAPKPVLLVEAGLVTLAAAAAAYRIGKLGFTHRDIETRINDGEITSFGQLKDELKADYRKRHNSTTPTPLT